MSKDINDLRREMRNKYRENGSSWSTVGEAFHISKGMAFRIVERHYEPKDIFIRARLGLPNIAQVVPVVGEIPNGTQAIRADQCACGQWFISNHPRRKKCFKCSPYRRKAV